MKYEGIIWKIFLLLTFYATVEDTTDLECADLSLRCEWTLLHLYIYHLDCVRIHTSMHLFGRVNIYSFVCFSLQGDSYAFLFYREYSTENQWHIHSDLLSYRRRVVSHILYLHIWKSLGTEFSSSRYLPRDSLQNGQNAIRAIFPCRNYTSYICIQSVYIW